MRLFGGLFGSIYIVIGIVIANTHHYLSTGGVRGVAGQAGAEESGRDSAAFPSTCSAPTAADPAGRC